MDYSEALGALKAGRRISRRSWIEPGKYVYWVPGSTITTPDGATRTLVAHALFVRPHKDSAEPWLPSFDAQSADDWFDADADA